MQKVYGDKYKYIWIVDKKGIKIDGKHTTVKKIWIKIFFTI